MSAVRGSSCTKEDAMNGYGRTALAAIAATQIEGTEVEPRRRAGEWLTSDRIHVREPMKEVPMRPIQVSNRILRRVAGVAACCLALATPGAASAACDYANAPYTIREFPVFFGGTNQENWSPDGTKIVFDDAGQIKLFDLDLWQVSGTLTPPMNANAPTWTENGKIFFEVDQGQSYPPGRTAPPQIWVMNENGSDLQVVDYPPGLPAYPPNQYRNGAGSFRISRDGKYFVFNAVVALDHWKVIVMNVNYEESGAVSLDTLRVLADEPNFNEVKGIAPDDRIQVASTRGGPDSGNSDLWLLSLDGQWERLTTSTAWDEIFDVNQDGAIAFMSDRDTSAYYQQYWASGALPRQADSVVLVGGAAALAGGTAHELYVAGPQGDHGWVRRLTFDFETSGRHVGQPKWNPDATKIRFTHNPPRVEAVRQTVARGELNAPATEGISKLLEFDCGG
jgi:hypothetical protein